MDEDTSVAIELIDYLCGDCSSDTWRLAVAHHPDGKTCLIVTCGNDECVAQKREELDVSEFETIVWNEFDITGQGYDMDDEPENLAPDSTLLN